MHAISLTLTFSLILTPSLIQTTPLWGTSVVGSKQNNTTFSLILRVNVELLIITAWRKVSIKIKKKDIYVPLIKPDLLLVLIHQSPSGLTHSFTTQ